MDFELPILVRSENSRNFAVGVVNVAGATSLCGAGVHTHGQFPFFQQVNAQSAFLNDFREGIQCSGIVWAGPNTILAAKATIAIHQNHTRFRLIGGFCRADFNASWNIAMHALIGEKEHL
jgi:hypothetical protein